MSAQPAFDPEEDIRPNLRVLEGGGHTSEPSGNLSEAPAPADDEDGLTSIDGGGESSPRSKGHLQAVGDDAKTLADKESSTDQVGEGYSGGKKRGKISLGKARKRGIISGLLIGIIFSAFGLGSFLSGPLEFLHFAESIHIPHFSRTENFSGSRVGKFFVYARTGSVGDTRLGWVQRQYKGRILDQMKKIGITPMTETHTGSGAGLDYLKDWVLDPSIKGSPIEGMSDKQAYDWAKSTFGDKQAVSVYKNKVYLKTDSFVSQTKTTYKLMEVQGASKVSAAARTRVLGKFFDVTFHPMNNLDKKLNTKVTDLYRTWKENRDTSIKKGATAVEVKASSTSTDSKGNTTTNNVGETATSSGVKSSINEFLTSPAGKVAGGALLGAGFVCTTHAIALQIGDFKYAQVILPLIRTGVEIMALEGQISNGKDVDTTQLDFYAQQFVQRDKGGKIINSWSDNSAIEANNGGSGGVDVSTAVKQSVKPGIPEGLQWATSPAVNALCSPVGLGVQLVAGVASIAFGGTIITDAVKVALQGVLIGAGVDFAATVLSGEAVTPGVGAELGGQADYGTFYAGNMMGMQFAGNELTPKQITALNQQAAGYEKASFQSKPLIARLFDAQDRHSFAGQVIDSHVFDAQNNIATLQEGLFNPLFGIFKLPSSMFGSSNAFAAAASYDYGAPTLGFSLEDQNNPIIAIPQVNADNVARLLDSPTGQSYVGRALKCYGVNISKGTEGWDVIPTSTDAFRATFADDKRDASCDTPTAQDPDWLRVRAFIADTASIEGWSCLQGDETACSNDGFGGTSTATTTTGTVGTAPSGTTMELAKQIWDSPNITFQTAQEKIDFQQIVQTGGQTACGGTQISSKLLGVILSLSQKYKLVLGVFAAGHGCDGGGAHPKGMAVDINGVNPISGGSGGSGTFIDSAHNSYVLPIVKQLYVDIANTLSSGGGGGLGQSQCFSGGPPISSATGVMFFPGDPCTHIHMDVWTR